MTTTAYRLQRMVEVLAAIDKQREVNPNYMCEQSRRIIDGELVRLQAATENAWRGERLR